MRSKIHSKFESVNISKVLQSKFKTGFENPVSILSDPTYLPFYYYLGNYLIGCKNLLEFGFWLGMPSGCFIYGCPTIEKFLAFRKKEEKYYAKRLGISNIHNVLKKKFDLWIGDETDPEFIKMVLSNKWDCIIVSDTNNDEKTHRSYLELAWGQTSHNGIIIVDFLDNDYIMSSYKSFCKSQNREPFLIKTLRGTGLLQK